MAIYSHNANDLTPTLTSNSSASPIIVSASTEYNSSYAAWKAFNHLVGASGWASTAGHTGWLKVYSGGPLWTVTSYTVSSCTDSLVAMAKDWTLQGSTDGSNWTVIDTQTGQASWTSDDMRTYTISSPGNYSYYKLDITDNCGNADATEVGELELIGTVYEAPPPPAGRIPSGDIVPQRNGFGGIGTTIKKWLNGYFYNIFATGGTISGVNMISDTGETISGPVTTSAGVGDANKLVALDAFGKVSSTMISGTTTVPGGIGISFESTDKPKSSGNYSCIVPYNMVIPANCVESVFSNITNPSSTVQVLIKVNDVTRITLSVSSSGVPTWTSSEIQITALSKITFSFPVQDSVWAGVIIFLKGTRS
jgi:hypothetical protein